MELLIARDHYTENSTGGQLWIDDVYFCYTLEPRADQSAGKPYCIPEGRYKVELLFSPRFQMVTPHLIGVPGFEEVEIHPGNYPQDTEGCTLIGWTRSADFIGNSRAAFGELMGKMTLPGVQMWATYSKGMPASVQIDLEEHA